MIVVVMVVEIVVMAVLVVLVIILVVVVVEVIVEVVGSISRGSVRSNNRRYRETERQRNVVMMVLHFSPITTDMAILGLGKPDSTIIRWIKKQDSS